MKNGIITMCDCKTDEMTKTPSSFKSGGGRDGGGLSLEKRKLGEETKTMYLLQKEKLETAAHGKASD